MSDFFAAEDRRNQTSSSPKTFISYNPISDQDLTPSLPRNTKYIIQQWRGSVVDHCSPIINLVLMPQKMAWVVGRMHVLFFNHETLKEQTDPTIGDRWKYDLEKTLAVLDPGCRFISIFCKSPEEVHTSMGNTEAIPFLPADGLENIRHYINPDDHYALLSKRVLALSGLPTPKSQLIDFAVPGTGWDKKSLDNEISRAINAIRSRLPPFVLKSNSAGGSKGVYLIRTMDDREMVEKDITKILHEELPNLNAENAHLNPFSLIMTEFLPGEAISVNFYVQTNGQGKAHACITQIFSENGHFWLGGSVVYSAQARLAFEYEELIQRTANFLHLNGYHGPAGIDVMTDETGVHNIVDINARPTGTFILGCLRSHFSGVLGMDAACTLPLMEFSASRKAFEEAFERELQIGQIVVLAWYSEPKTQRCSTYLAASAVDTTSLEQLCGAIQKWVVKNQVQKEVWIE